MNKAALQELVEASVGSLRDCSEQYAALKDRHRALLARVAVLEKALEEITDPMHWAPSIRDKDASKTIRWLAHKALDA